MAKDLAVSPLAPARFPDLLPVTGVRFGMTYAGIRYKPGRNDLLVALFPEGTTLAGVYTKSLTASPAVHWCRNALQAAKGHARALIVTAGNSTAGTGADGDRACRAIAEGLAGHLGCAPEEVQFSATGVIGEPFPASKLIQALPAALESAEANVWEAAARAIMTTDTYPKGTSQTAVIDGVAVNISGFVKGSGMIQPNMATMLGYLFTDARLPADVLDALLHEAVEKTFNCITVDGDTSTSDTVQLFATGAAAHGPVTSADDPRLADFRARLFDACLELATLVVKDGEGAQKFITINVSGAQTFEDARTLGLSIGNSPLVKTAIAGADANWGRVVMAVGKAGPLIDPNRLSVAFGGTTICRDGLRVEGYDEGPVAEHLKGRDVVIDVDVGVGDASATVYTCDLTHGYISINGDYRS
ncbi:bifunctional glutamate N-acetyltransferase/amino-acid acetyltransferase ArgJ [Pedomonas mirosovicensis]|uniref:bifunctional glutamate N-acetyltransferase/amino-acid acetyltransferase ArgJ n=1 Tax=Pedomonas mirosovicensis TaxID=2908641 RepID=UPI002168BA40|nr:bifunctional glutamate N-acetyltransferase/amino-acid acetyltransferase ArgJ [Pedomonas mirosovicensis]MCH8684370.1 bifunctional glutamate N-acetyltransferase/amino-acid acetyltransferase ArgJ [Pedomonas mirosovicensis]